MTNPNAPLLIQAAAAAAGQQHFPVAALYVVATPIGNLADLSLRAIHVLGLADAIACEDTRHSGRLLQQLGIARPLLAVHQHNELGAAQAVLQRLAEGQRVAYVSDAGTPAVSDPGAALVGAVQAAGFPTVPVPGPSSAIAALSVAGDARSRSGFRFVGFLPARGGERQAALQALRTEPATQVLFEAPHRIAALAASLAEWLPDRRITFCRELTKQFEAITTMAAADLPGWLAADANRQRGEFAVVVHGTTAAQDTAPCAITEHHLLAVLMRELPLKQSVALAAELTGAPRNAVYRHALTLKDAAAG